MGKLITAHESAARGDYGHADQEGETTCPDTVFVQLRHSPWAGFSQKADDTLWGLEPPKSLTRDFNKEIIQGTYPEAWENTNYEERYKEHLKKDKDAKQDIFAISAMARNQKVCLICQDEFYHFCIRRLVYEYMRDNGDINP